MGGERTSGTAPMVSVNIPGYHQLPYLQSCIATIQAQTLGDFAVNVLDDGQSDEYREYVESVGDARIRYHRNGERLGAMQNMFQAIFAGTGKYSLAFHEDDLLEPFYLETAVGVLESHPRSGFVAAEVREFREAPAAPPPRSADHCPAYDIFESSADFVRGLLRGVEPMFGSVVYRRAALAEAKSDHERFGTLADRPFLLSILRNWSAAVIREPVAWYRGHGDADNRHRGLSSRRILELLKTYRGELLEQPQRRDEALFYPYATDLLVLLYRLTPDGQKPSFGRFMFQAWREGVYNPRWERHFGLGKMRLAISSH
jgi:glycosyltransferase involved in cell wall biosynthesis